jgi:hypothetical protein
MFYENFLRRGDVRERCRTVGINSSEFISNERVSECGAIFMQEGSV